SSMNEVTGDASFTFDPDAFSTGLHSLTIAVSGISGGLNVNSTGAGVALRSTSSAANLEANVDSPASVRVSGFTPNGTDPGLNVFIAAAHGNFDTLTPLLDGDSVYTIQVE